MYVSLSSSIVVTFSMYMFLSNATVKLLKDQITNLNNLPKERVKMVFHTVCRRDIEQIQEYN